MAEPVLLCDQCGLTGLIQRIHSVENNLIWFSIFSIPTNSSSDSSKGTHRSSVPVPLSPSTYSVMNLPKSQTWVGQSILFLTAQPKMQSVYSVAESIHQNQTGTITQSSPVRTARPALHVQTRPSTEYYCSTLDSVSHRESFQQSDGCLTVSLTEVLFLKLQPRLFISVHVI